MSVFVLVFLLVIPAFAAHAATNAQATAITSNSLVLNWTKQAGEGSVQIYKNGVLLASSSGTSYSVTGLSVCTAYTFDIVGSGSFGSTSVQATTLGCPSAPVISYTTTHSSISLSWSASNAVSYDIYKSNTYITTTSGTSYTLSATPSTSIEVKIVARNSTGQTASSTVWASTPGYSDSYTGTAYGNIQVGGTFKNTNSTYSTTMYLTLYRVTSSGDQYVGSTSFSVGAGQTINGYYPIATSQPYGTYKVTFSSPYITASSVSFSTF
ncbi:hypothetical protein [Paenibacillus sp. NPDC058174]|uniref:hypothetical protein n=1 Tax=Paenibacillus sp. NPDC058174 TaxID=3346366 RepID=UPI0036D8C48B